MQLEHTFTVPAGVDQAWQVLLDIERVAPCMPGASLDSVHGDEFTGTVKVRLGPIGLTYKGKASFLEKDEQAHRVVIDAQGRDARGNGTASAKVTATLQPDGEQSTTVAVHTDLNITGKPAQFGRGVMVDVGNKLIGQFADCLAGKLAGTEAAPPPEAESAPVAEGAGESVPAAEPGPSAPAETAEQAASATPATGEPPSSLEQAVSTGEPAAAGIAVSTEQPATAEQPAVAAAGTAAIAEPAALSGGTGPGSAAAVSPEGPSQPSRHAASEAEPIDLLSSAGPAVLKRLAPVAIAAVLAVLLYVILRRRR